VRPALPGEACPVALCDAFVALIEAVLEAFIIGGLARIGEEVPRET